MALTHYNRPAQESDIIEALQAEIAVERGRVTTANAQGFNLAPVQFKV